MTVRSNPSDSMSLATPKSRVTLLLLHRRFPMLEPLRSRIHSFFTGHHLVSPEDFVRPQPDSADGGRPQPDSVDGGRPQLDSADGAEFQLCSPDNGAPQPGSAGGAAPQPDSADGAGSQLCSPGSGALQPGSAGGAAPQPDPIGRIGPWYGSGADTGPKRLNAAGPHE